MNVHRLLLRSIVLVGAVLAMAEASASTVTFGRITAVRGVDLQNQGAQTAGALDRKSVV